MRARTALFAATLLCSTAAFADDDIPPVVGGRTYTQHLITTAKAKHPEITSIVVEGKRDGGGDGIVVLGSTQGAANVFKPLAHADMTVGGKVSSDGRSYVSRVPFNSSTHHRIGTIIVTFAHKKGASTSSHDRTAQSVAASMAKVMLSGKNAVDPYPYDPKFSPNTYAQQLTMRMMTKNPDVLVMMIHATPPSGGNNVVIGSNIGRIGKIADEDDLRIINTGATNLEVAGEGDDRYETAMPLLDARGKQIGALGIVFPLAKGADKKAIEARGRAIRDEVARQIPDNAALFKPAA